MPPAGNRNKSDAAIEAGAEHIWSHEEAGFGNQVNQLTNKKGVDIVLNSISGTVFDNSLKCLAVHGRLVVFGNLSGGFAQFGTADLHSSCRAVLGYCISTTRDNRLEMIEDATEAHGWVESRNVGKALLKVNKG